MVLAVPSVQRGREERPTTSLSEGAECEHRLTQGAADTYAVKTSATEADKKSERYRPFVPEKIPIREVPSDVSIAGGVGLEVGGDVKGRGGGKQKASKLS